jgi:hypothetical protein
MRTTASGGADYAGSGAPTAANTWYHVVAAYDGSGMTFFLNGVQMGSASPSTRLLINDNQPLLLGCRLVNPTDYNTYTEYFQGAIAEVSLYTVALTARQVRSHYYAASANGSP